MVAFSVVPLSEADGTTAGHLMASGVAEAAGGSASVRGKRTPVRPSMLRDSLSGEGGYRLDGRATDAVL